MATKSTIVVDTFGNAHPADSKEEVWIADALKYYDIPFFYHYEERGGSEVGGFVVDFMVDNAGFVPLEYFGEWWHSIAKEESDVIKIAYLESRYGRVVIWEGDDIQSPEAARNMVQYEFV